MSTIQMQKRTRTVATDPWGAWANTTDSSPFIDDPLFLYEYKTTTDIENTIIRIEDITSNVAVSTDGKFTVTGDGILDKIMESHNKQIKAQYDFGSILQSEYSQVYVSALNSATEQAIRFVSTRESSEQQADGLKIKNAIDNANKQDKIDTSASALRVTLGSEPYKITLAQYQSDKALADVNMTAAQQKALEEQVVDNRYIKAIDSLADTYGTFGAGGLSVSSEQWNKYYGLISQLIEDLRDYKGEWDATTSFPGEIDGILGDFWVVSVGGIQTVDGSGPWVAGDIVYYDGSKWKKPDGLPTSVEPYVVV